VYDFEKNPAREAHGKLLLYFWLGLFDGDNALASLAAGRLSMAIFAVITGAGVYQLGRIFANRRAGLIALLVYALMPLAVFYERMALADPLASGLMVLVVWCSYVFAKHPTYRQGGILGILIALATLAKLTMLLAVFSPLVAALIYGHKKRNWKQFIKIYLLPLVVTGAIFCALWSPFVVPAFLARNSDAPYVLVNARNIERTENDPTSIGDYLERLMPGVGNFMLDDHTIRVFGIAGYSMPLPTFIRFQVVWWIIGIWLLGLPFSPNHHVYIGSWFMVVTILLVTISSFVSTRYFMPVAAPLAVMVGMFLSPHTSGFAAQGFYWHILRIVRWIVGGVFAVWLVLWCIPFIVTMVTAPDKLPFDASNWLEYQSGIVSADEATSVTARIVTDLNTNEPIYSSWNLCHTIYFLIEQAITCIPQEDAPGHLVQAVQALADGGTLLLLTSGYPPFYEEWEFVSHTILAENDHEVLSRPIQIIRLTYHP
jgi:4-amino-4-deoxy-L-arabinose transferase-like glycosyltransferase